jgi:predicted DNA-binding transcriptional regulator AlpA
MATNTLERPVERRALTLDQLASTLSIGRSKGWQLIRTGQIPSIRVADSSLGDNEAIGPSGIDFGDLGR